MFKIYGNVFQRRNVDKILGMLDKLAGIYRAKYDIFLDDTNKSSMITRLVKRRLY